MISPKLLNKILLGSVIAAASLFLVHSKVYACSDSVSAGDSSQPRCVEGVPGGDYAASATATYAVTQGWSSDSSWYVTVCVLAPDGNGSNCMADTNRGGSTIQVPCGNTNCTYQADLTMTALSGS